MAISSPLFSARRPGTDRQDLALLRLLLGGVGDDEAADGRLLGLGRPYDDPVFQRLQIHRYILLEGNLDWTGGRVVTTAGLALPHVEC